MHWYFCAATRCGLDGKIIQRRCVPDEETDQTGMRNIKKQEVLSTLAAVVSCGLIIGIGLLGELMREIAAALTIHVILNAYDVIKTKHER